MASIISSKGECSDIRDTQLYLYTETVQACLCLDSWHVVRSGFLFLYFLVFMAGWPSPVKREVDGWTFEESRN